MVMGRVSPITSFARMRLFPRNSDRILRPEQALLDRNSYAFGSRAAFVMNGLVYNRSALFGFFAN